MTPDSIAKANAQLERQPTDANAWYKKAEAHRQSGDIATAISAYNQALKLKPDFAEACYALAQALETAGKTDLAIKTYAHWLKIQHTGDVTSVQDSAETWIDIGKSYYFQGQYALAIAAYEEASKIQPNNIDLLTELLRLRGYFCHWEQAAALRATVETFIAAGACADPCIVTTCPPPLHLKNTQRWSEKYYNEAKPYDVTRALPADRRKDGKLRIGYLSSDLYHHATALLINELFELHDRRQFEIYAYSSGKNDGGEERRRAASAVDYFHDISTLSDTAAARVIETDGIDILVDLKGYTLGHRLGILAQRPAPVQIHYLGYPGSTGFKALDYFIADAFTAPAGSDSCFSEKLIRLPHSYQINDRKRIVPEAALPRVAFGLPENVLVFCAFNNPYKITPEVFACWMRILHAVENSVLWLYESRPGIGASLKRRAQAQGIDPSRLVMATPMPANQHILRHFHADLALDTAPICGHTTTSDALWAGVPVVTLFGETFISRVAAGLLKEVGLQELAVQTLEEYEKLATALAKDKTRLASFKKHLKNGRMYFPLFDSAATARAIETAYLHAIALHRAGTSPRAFSVANQGTVVEH